MRVRYIMKSIEKRDRAVYGSIPAMRVRYIFHVRYTTSPRPGSIPAMRVRYIINADVSYNIKEGSIPAMRVRYIVLRKITITVDDVVQFPLCG